MTEDQRKVYDILKSNDGWMQSPDIALKGNFDRMVDATASLTALIKSGYVDSINQKLFDGTVLTFYRIIKEYEPKKMWFVEMINDYGYTIKMQSFSSKEEAFKYIELRKLDENFSFIKSTYRLYEAQEVGEY